MFSRPEMEIQKETGIQMSGIGLIVASPHDDTFWTTSFINLKFRLELLGNFFFK
jgi:hypothetical protein